MQAADSVGLEWDPRICISKEIPGDAVVAGPHFKNHWAGLIIMDFIMFLVFIMGILKSFI